MVMGGEDDPLDTLPENWNVEVDEQPEREAQTPKVRSEPARPRPCQARDPSSVFVPWRPWRLGGSFLLRTMPSNQPFALLDARSARMAPRRFGSGPMCSVVGAPCGVAPL